MSLVRGVSRRRDERIDVAPWALELASVFAYDRRHPPQPSPTVWVPAPRVDPSYRDYRS